MKFVCSVGDKTWFSFETEHEAVQESALLSHAVEKYFRAEYAKARETYRPGPGLERDIGLKAHIARTMPLFLTLRAGDGEALATAMLPPNGQAGPHCRIIIVGPRNGDPYPQNAAAISGLGKHFKLDLSRERCFPYA